MHRTHENGGLGELQGLQGVEQGINHRCHSPGRKVGELRGLVAMPGESQGVQRLQLLSWRKPVFLYLDQALQQHPNQPREASIFGSSRHSGSRQWWVAAVDVLLDAPDCFWKQ